MSLFLFLFLKQGAHSLQSLDPQKIHKSPAFPRPSFQLLVEKRGRPQIPWPEVQPFPTRVPIPTATPGVEMEKKIHPGCLGYFGGDWWYYPGNIGIIIRIPIKQPGFHGKYGRFFFRGLNGVSATWGRCNMWADDRHHLGSRVGLYDGTSRARGEKTAVTVMHW